MVAALDFLTASNRRGLGDTVAEYESGQLNVKGKNIVVIGGGDTAMDCVRTAIRQDAKSVSCVYRRDRANMPGSAREVMNAEEEGVAFEWLSQPTGLSRDKNGKVNGVICQRSRLGAADASGRQRPEPITDSEYTLDADMVIMALGFDPEDMPNMVHEPRLKVSRWGTIGIDWRSMMTSVDGVFAAGDIVRGASLVVWGIRDGRDAATHIDEWLTRQAAEKADASIQQAQHAGI
jgi:glutamate synthase (NADPH/NADH) small chain